MSVPLLSSDIYAPTVDLNGGHSTETTLTEVHSDSSYSLDEGSIAALILLVLAAAFDVTDHIVQLFRIYFEHSACGSHLAEVLFENWLQIRRFSNRFWCSTRFYFRSTWRDHQTSWF